MAGIRARGIGGSWTEHEVEDRPLTLICHKGDMQVEVPDAITIDIDMTRYHGNRVVKIDPFAKAWAEYILGYQLEDYIQPSDRSDSQAHVIGMCDLPIKLMQQQGKALPFFIKEPETFLHPSQQTCVTDWLVSMINNTTDDGSFTELPPNMRNWDNPWPPSA
jgi:hypothetical protein